MLSVDMPVKGDETGNNMKWDSLVLESELYMRTGNYALLRNVRMRQGHFVELEGKGRVALAYYCMAFYADLNGFDSLDRMLNAKQARFHMWKSCAHVDVGIINKIFLICSTCGLSDADLKAVCRRSFVPGSFQCHLFTIDECQEILFLARDGSINEISSQISNAENRFLLQFGPAKQYMIN
jgi:hypothetical protein